MKRDNPQNSSAPSPRPGIAGWLDQLTGPGATPAELVLQFIPAVIAAVLAPLNAVSIEADWSTTQLALISLLALDLVGGVLTNATGAAKRWFHRQGQGPLNHFGFVFLHLFHIALVAVVFRNWDTKYFVLVSAYLLIASFLVIHSPLYLQRATGLGLFALGLIGSNFLLEPTQGLEWFLPLFFLKLLVAHLIFEIPFRPKHSAANVNAAVRSI